MRISKEEKAARLEDWKQSGKSIWAYAKDNGLNPQTFSNWVKSEGKRTSGFVEIHKQLKPKPETIHVILIEKGDIKIHVPLSVWIEYPTTIMEALKEIP